VLVDAKRFKLNISGGDQRWRSPLPCICSTLHDDVPILCLSNRL
jgi:hypothetical protein